MTADPSGLPEPTNGGFDLDLAVSALASTGGDIPMMMRLLGEELADALGDRLVVERRGGVLRRGSAVRSLQVTLGDDVLRAEVDGGAVRCTIGHSSGGIRIRSESVDMATWLKRLLVSLESEAQRSETARTALEHLMMGGTP
ncbi:MAG: hypothetical protein ACRDVP_04935 [Acidimicrobiales bacterium]